MTAGQFEQAKGWPLTFRRKGDGSWKILAGSGEHLLAEGGTWSLKFGEELFALLVNGRRLRHEERDGVKFYRTTV